MLEGKTREGKGRRDHGQILIIGSNFKVSNPGIKAFKKGNYSREQFIQK